MANISPVPTRNKAVREFLARQGRKGGKAGAGVAKQVSMNDQHAKVVLAEVKMGRLTNAQRFLENLPAHSDYCPALRRRACTCVIGRARKAYQGAQR